MKTKWLLISVCMLYLSCEKAVQFDLQSAAPRLVVEASIENDQPPRVILSNSLNFFSRITPDMLAASFVHNAEIFISNGRLTHKLKEYTTPLSGGYALYYYSLDSSQPATAFTGELNQQYQLRIVLEGKEYRAITHIPAITRRIDSLFWKRAPANIDSNKVVLMLKATDRPGYGDYIRYFTKRNSEPFYPALNSVYDDQIIDGSRYEIEVERGVDRSRSLPDDYVFFEKGDTVTFKLCQIDKATYDFWRTMEFSYASTGNPFSSPAKVMGNISNGALGYFGGYAAQYRTVVIPR